MTAARKLDETQTMRARRRDIATGEVMPEHRSSALSPIRMARSCLTSPPGCRGAAPGSRLPAPPSPAVEKKLFARAAKAQVRRKRPGRPHRESAGGAHPGRSGPGAPRRPACAGLRQCAAHAGQPVAAGASGRSPGWLRRRQAQIYNAAHARGLKPVVVECLFSAELGLALGRENVIHAAVHPGGLAERLMLDAAP